jgi:hypothetical protein
MKISKMNKSARVWRVSTLVFIGIMAFAWKLNYDMENSSPNLDDSVQMQAVSYAYRDYFLNHNGRLPDARHWEDELMVYNQDFYEKPTFRLSRVFTIIPKFGYQSRRIAMNQNLSGLSLDQLKNHDRTVVFYAAVTDKKNATGNPPPDNFLTKLDFKHQLFVFANGHILEFYPSAGFK